jgi:hypothetical protein
MNVDLKFLVTISTTAADERAAIEKGHGLARELMTGHALTAGLFDRVEFIPDNCELREALKNALNVLAAIATGDLKTIDRDSPAIAKCRAALAGK